MNDETKYKYELAKMYEFICRIDRICQRYNYDYLSVVSDELSYNAIAMCLVQLGERANHIKNTNIEKFKEKNNIKIFIIKKSIMLKKMLII